MRSYEHPKQAFTPEELETLDLVLTSALASAKELGLRPDVLKRALCRRLLMIASEGISDPETLRARTLKSMNIDRIASYPRRKDRHIG